jgi:hypothetical protein
MGQRRDEVGQQKRLGEIERMTSEGEMSEQRFLVSPNPRLIQPLVRYKAVVDTSLRPPIDGSGSPEAVSAHQNLPEPKNDGYVFWDQNLCIVFDTHSPISLTGIDKIKHLSSICIHIIFLIFIIHRPTRTWLKVEVIHATK